MAQENRCTPMITGLSIRSNVPVDDRLVYDVTPDNVMLPEYRRYEGMVR